jgi:hypothetical protein
MFSALLIGQTGWYSRRCKLTWKVKGTKYNRMYFQLRASAIAPTNGTEFGLLHTEQQHLLKTPTAMDGEVTSGKKNPVSGNSGTLAQEIMSGYKPTMEKLGLLPTPTTMDMLPPKTDKAWEKEMTETRPGRTMPSNLRDVPFRTGLLLTPTTREEVMDLDKFKKRMEKYPNGTTMPNLATQVVGMLPTPTAQIIKHGHSEKYWDNRIGKRQTDLGMWNAEHNGKTSQLNPQFVLEMMGFPPNWTELPFLSGETNQSKPPETPLCPK